MKRLVAGILIAASLGLSSAFASDWKQYSPSLKEGWEVYRDHFIQESDGRVIDHRVGLSTSEGQSYAMLRAVWMRDKQWFDKAYQWGKNNLQVRDDHLFAWKWGEKPDGSWGVLDKTSASDADQDMALALLMASEIWDDVNKGKKSDETKDPYDGKYYKKEALALLDDIWEHDTIQTPIGRVVLPGDWKSDGRTSVQINPSYFAPAAYRVFAEVDRDHPWKQLIENAYKVTQASVDQSSTHLPTDWVELNLKDGSIHLYKDALDTRSDYGYEAIRVYWRLGLDYILTGEPQAEPILKASHFLPRFWKIRGDLPGALTYDGIQRDPKLISGAVYGAPLIGIYYQNADVAQDIVTRQIVPNLKPGAPWNTENDYYTQNWLWLGLALYQAEQKNIDFPRKLDALERIIWLMNYEE